MLAPVKPHTYCAHCHSLVDQAGRYSDQEKQFCCLGCQTLYNCLKEHHLDDFYNILASENRYASKVSSKDSFEFLLDKDFLQDFGQGTNLDSFYFYIDGIDCMACSWAIQNVGKLSEQILDAEFFLSNNVLKIKISTPEILPTVAHFISGLGYKIIPLKNMEAASGVLRKERISQLKRIGITGAILMNMMIYAVSIYAGADGSFKSFFSHVQAILFLPVLLYSAWPFYKSVYSQIRQKVFTIDFPITLSIILGAALSYRSYLIGSDAYYFDSLTTFIFLILSTRYLLYFLYRKEISKKIFSDVYGQQQVNKVIDSKIYPKHISRIQKGDKIIVKKGDIVPLDGEVVQKGSYLNESLITGESDPIYKDIGQKVFSGSKNLSQDLLIKVIASSKENSFLNYLSALNFDISKLNNYSTFGAQYAFYLTILVSMISIALLLVEPTSISIQKVLSLFIVCCPCALGIGIPLSIILKIKAMAKRGVLIKEGSLVDQISQIKTLSIDKTGTLTTGSFRVNYIDGDQRYLSYLVALEISSEHPIARFITHYYREHDRGLKVVDFIEIPGKGVEGKIEGDYYQACSSNGDIQLLKNGARVFTLSVEEILSFDDIAYVDSLTEKFHIEILSGDTKSKVEHFSQFFANKDKIHFYSELTPKEKQEHIKKSENTLYIGDGLNDILAMKDAKLSISLNASRLVDDVCNIVFFGGGIRKLKLFFSELNHLNFLIKSNIAISIVYNAIAIYLVLMGHVGPLAAAILMPLSSLTVVLHSFLQIVYQEKNG